MKNIISWTEFEDKKHHRYSNVIKYSRKEWKTIILSYLFIILSMLTTRNTSFLSPMNSAIWVLIWYTISTIFSIFTFVDQNNSNYKIKKAMHFNKKHKNASVKITPIIEPEIGGWTSGIIQLFFALILYSIFIIIAFKLQTNVFTAYMIYYKDFFLSTFVDTYIVAFLNLLILLIFNTICDCIDAHKANQLKFYAKKNFHLTIKNILAVIACITITFAAFYYFFHSEFGGPFKRIIGGLYILFMMWPGIKEINDHMFG